MAWTNSCSTDFYKKFVRQNAEYFEEETIREADMEEVQTTLGEFAESVQI